MQVSDSLANFMTRLDSGASGVDDALAAVQACADDHAGILDLQQMSLTDEDLPAIIAKLGPLASHVKTLNLFLNEISVLPAGFSALSNLEVLQVGANPLEQIEADLLKALPKLKELDIGYNELMETIPDAFQNLSDLRILFAGNARIAALPPSLFECAALEELHLYGNSLKELSPDVGKLSKLRTLNIGRNQIAELPAQLAECGSLEVLHLYENCLDSVPRGLNNIASLKILNVASNECMPFVPREVRCEAEPARAIAAFLSKQKV